MGTSKGRPIQTIALVQTNHRRRGAAVHLEGCTSLSRLGPVLLVAEEILPGDKAELGQVACCIAHVWASIGEQLGERWANSVSVTDLTLEQVTRALEGTKYYGIGWSGGRFYLPGAKPERVREEDYRGSDWLRLAREGTRLHERDYFLRIP